MKVTYLILELSDTEKVNPSDLARLAGVKEDAVVVDNLSHCTSGYRRQFATLVDLYVWTNKYWYGTYCEKLTFVEIRGICTLPLTIRMKHSAVLRLAIASNKLCIFNRDELSNLKEASAISNSFWHEERIEKLRPLVKKLECNFSLLYIDQNPFD